MAPTIGESISGEQPTMAADRLSDPAAGDQGPVEPREGWVSARFTSMQPGFWWRAMLAGAAALILGLGTLAAIRALAQTLAVLALALTIASAFAPLVDWMGRRIPRLAAISVVYLAIPLLLALLGYLTIPPVTNQLQDVTASIPDLINKLQPLLSRLGDLVPGNLGTTLTSQLSSLATAVVSLPFTILNSLLDLVAVLFISIYVLLAAPSIREFVLSLVPPDHRQPLADLLHEMLWEMGGYLRGAFLDGMIIGVSSYIGLRLIGVNFPLLLSAIAAILEIVPTVGPIIAAVPMLIVALLQSPTKALITLIFVVALHQLEGNIIFPNVMRSQTSLPPLLVLLALFGGYAAGGLLGAVTAIPVMAISRVFVLRVVAPAVRRQTGAATAVQSETGGGKRPAGTKES